MKTVLVICESGYWHDLREGLAAVNIGFFGFDKKKPKRSELEQLVAQADFVMIRNLNVAHASVRFAKEAAKSSGTPFWIGSNFGVEKIREKLKLAFPELNLSVKETKQKTVKKKSIKKQKTDLYPALEADGKYQPAKQRKNLALKTALKDFKVDDEPDFEKMFKSFPKR